MFSTQRLHGELHVRPVAALHRRVLTRRCRPWSTRSCGPGASSTGRNEERCGCVRRRPGLPGVLRIFDQLGPQLKWWAWNVDDAYYRPTIEGTAGAGVTVDKLGGIRRRVPTLASVPWGSVWLFATVSFRGADLSGGAIGAEPDVGRQPAPRVVAGLADRRRRRRRRDQHARAVDSDGGVRPRCRRQPGRADGLCTSSSWWVVWVIGLALLYGQWRRLRAQPSLGVAESVRHYPFVVVFGPLFPHRALGAVDRRAAGLLRCQDGSPPTSPRSGTCRT